MAKDTIAIESSDPLERRTRNGNSKTRSEIGVLIEEQYGERIEVLNLPHRTWLDIILKLGRRLAGIGTSRSFLCWLVEARQRRLRVNVYRKLFSLFTEVWLFARSPTVTELRLTGSVSCLVYMAVDNLTACTGPWSHPSHRPEVSAQRCLGVEHSQGPCFGAGHGASPCEAGAHGLA